MEFSRQEYWSGLAILFSRETSWPRSPAWHCFHTEASVCLWPTETPSTKRLINDHLDLCWPQDVRTGENFAWGQFTSQGFHHDLTWDNEVIKPGRSRIKREKEGGPSGKGFYLRTQNQSTFFSPSLILCPLSSDLRLPADSRLPLPPFAFIAGAREDASIYHTSSLSSLRRTGPGHGLAADFYLKVKAHNKNITQHN